MLFLFVQNYIILFKSLKWWGFERKLTQNQSVLAGHVSGSMSTYRNTTPITASRFIVHQYYQRLYYIYNEMNEYPIFILQMLLSIATYK